MLRVMQRIFYFVGGQSRGRALVIPSMVQIVWNLATSKPHSEVEEVSGWFWDPFNVGGAIGMRNLVELR